MVAKEGRSHSRPRSPSVTECAPLAVLVVTRFGDDPYPTLRKAAALLHSNVTELSKLHLWVARVALLVNLVLVALLVVSWFFLCNNGYVPFSTACNDLRWCCVNFPSPWCPNVGPCTPNVFASDLVRTGEFFQMLIFSILFFLWALAHRTVNVDIRDYGVFQTSYDSEWPARKALNAEDE